MSVDSGVHLLTTDRDRVEVANNYINDTFEKMSVNTMNWRSNDLLA